MSFLSLFSGRSSSAAASSASAANTTLASSVAAPSPSVLPDALTLVASADTADQAPAHSIELDDTEKAFRRQIREAWKLAANAKTVTAAQHATYTLLMGKSLERAFTPITNTNKLSNGQSAHAGRDNALWRVSRLHCDAFAPWASLLVGAAKDRGGYAFEDASASPILERARLAATTFKAQG